MPNCLWKVVFHALITSMVLALGALATSVDAYAQTAPVTEFDIPAQPLESALRKLAESQNLQIIFTPEDVKGVMTAGVKGRFTAREAIQELVKGTGLTVTTNGSNVFAIKPAIARGARTSEAEAAAVPAESTGSVHKAEQITVTGTNVRGVKDIAAPSITITHSEIQQSGVATTEDLFRSLPQNFALIAPDAFFGTGVSNIAQQNYGRASAVDLRGLGPQSTLVLLNGNRLAGTLSGRVVDVSTIPLSIIDRVEVVTGGRSAIYGSDAVGGVVNLITRHDFTGAESQITYGGSQYGGDRLQFSQSIGRNGERGGFVAAYDYSREWVLDLVERGLVISPASNGRIPLRRDLLPDSWRHSGFVSGWFALSNRVELYADALYTDKNSKAFSNQDLQPRGTRISFNFTDYSSEVYRVTTGAKIDLNRAWSLDLSGGISEDKDTRRSNGFIDLGTISASFGVNTDDKVALSTLSAIASGPLWSIAGAVPKAAIGVQTRQERFEGANPATGAKISKRDRTVNSAFGELVIPLFEESSPAGIRHLEVSLAGRQDDYSDFGSTLNPQVGLIWKPTREFAFRSAYSSAFRAPALVEKGAINSVQIFDRSDPRTGGNSPVLMWFDGNPNLGPEKAKTASAGIDWNPAFAPRSRVSLNLFDIRYRNRIDVPATGADLALVLQREQRFPDLITRNPSASQVAAILGTDSDGVIANNTGRAWNPATQDILSVFPDLIVFDDRINNIALEKVRGVDLLINSEIPLGPGSWNVGVNATYTLSHKRSLTATSPEFDLVNEVGKPAKFRARANAGWKQGPWGAFAYINFVNSYKNPFSTTSTRIGSWTTIDASLRFDGSRPLVLKWLAGISATLSVENVFNKAPPLFANSSFDLLYDPTNASATGRYVSLRLVKSW